VAVEATHALVTHFQELKMNVVPSSSTVLVKLRDATEFSGGCSVNTPTRSKDCPDKYHDDDDNDSFPAFTSNITKKSYPKDFKPVGIPKYDSKQDPHQWIRCYSMAIEVSGGSNSTKAFYSW
jgi:hypothetical protein